MLAAGSLQGGWPCIGSSGARGVGAACSLLLGCTSSSQIGERGDAGDLEEV